jgi:hypothetical protein
MITKVTGWMDPLQGFWLRLLVVAAVRSWVKMSFRIEGWIRGELI